MRINLDDGEVELLIEALEGKKLNILDEMMAPGFDEYEGAVEALRNHDVTVRRLRRLLERKQS